MSPGASWYHLRPQGRREQVVLSGYASESRVADGDQANRGQGAIVRPHLVGYPITVKLDFQADGGGYFREIVGYRRGG